MSLVVHPIATCEGPRDLSWWTYRMNIGTKSRSAIYVWYIEGGQSKVVIDTGTRAKALTDAGQEETDLISAEDGLAKWGLKPEDVDIVIVTHLHWDHLMLAPLYKNAKFVIQKKELEYARNPHPLDAAGFRMSVVDKLNLEVIDGDTTIVPGVSVFLTPGHTPGGQSVEVDTASGKAIITGFCCTMANFVQTEEMKRKGLEVAPVAQHQDARDSYDSVLKIKRRADIILPLHEAAFITKESIP